MSEIVNGFWYGTLTPLQIISLQSFVNNGHQYKLWIYPDAGKGLKFSEPGLDIPAGIEVCDANEIIPFRYFFKHWTGSVATFADMFRYKLLYERGGWWADLDIINLAPLPKGIPIFFGGERAKLTGAFASKTPYKYWIGLMKFPKGHPVMGQMWQTMFDNIPILKNKVGSKPTEFKFGQNELEKIVFGEVSADEIFPIDKSGHSAFIDRFNPLSFFDMIDLMTDKGAIGSQRLEDIVIRPKWGWNGFKFSEVLNGAYTIHLYNKMVEDYKEKHHGAQFLLLDYFRKMYKI